LAQRELPPSTNVYGKATTPAPSRAHTCKRRKRVEKSWTATTTDDCTACQLERDGWHQLLGSFHTELGLG
jgi:hypothetical protein